MAQKQLERNSNLRYQDARLELRNMPEINYHTYYSFRENQVPDENDWLVIDEAMCIEGNFIGILNVFEGE